LEHHKDTSSSPTLTTPNRTGHGITCAACEDADGPWVQIDGIYLCEECLDIAGGGQ
jgi:hypothetical protein